MTITIPNVLAAATGLASRVAAHFEVKLTKAPQQEDWGVRPLTGEAMRSLEDDVRDKLRALAAQHGRSMEEEVREILREATLRASIEDDVRLGSRLAARFREHCLDGEIEEL